MHVVKWRKERQSVTESDVLYIRASGVPNSPGRWSRPGWSVPVTLDGNNIIKMVDYEGRNCKHWCSRIQRLRTIQLREFLFLLGWGWGAELCKADTKPLCHTPPPSLWLTSLTPEIPSILYFHDNWSFVSLLTLCYPFSSFSMSLINSSTPLPLLNLPFLSSFPSFHCFIYVSAQEWLFFIFPWKWNFIAVRNLVCLSCLSCLFFKIIIDFPCPASPPWLSCLLHNRHFFVTHSLALLCACCILYKRDVIGQRRSRSPYRDDLHEHNI